MATAREHQDSPTPVDPLTPPLSGFVFCLNTTETMWFEMCVLDTAFHLHRNKKKSLVLLKYSVVTFDTEP